MLSYAVGGNLLIFLTILTEMKHSRLKYTPLGTHQAAPTTDREMAKPIPRLAHMKGEVSVRNL